MFVVRLVILELAIAVLRFYVLDSLRPGGNKLLNILQSTLVCVGKWLVVCDVLNAIPNFLEII